MIYSDSDHAGCLKTRRSTSSTIAMFGTHCLRATSTTQNVVALSSGESEFYAAVKSASIGLGIKSLGEDFGVFMPNPVEVRIDASACLGIASRKGAGRIRHIATPTLWLQQAVQEHRLAVLKVKGTQNPADLGTKHVDAKVIQHAWSTCGFLPLLGKSKQALKAACAA